MSGRIGDALTLRPGQQIELGDLIVVCVEHVMTPEPLWWFRTTGDDPHLIWARDFIVEKNGRLISVSTPVPPSTCRRCGESIQSPPQRCEFAYANSGGEMQVPCEPEPPRLSEQVVPGTPIARMRRALRELYAIEVHRQGWQDSDPDPTITYGEIDGVDIGPCGDRTTYGWSPYLTERLVTVQHQLAEAFNALVSLPDVDSAVPPECAECNGTGLVANGLPSNGPDVCTACDNAFAEAEIEAAADSLPLSQRLKPGDVVRHTSGLGGRITLTEHKDGEHPRWIGTDQMGRRNTLWDELLDGHDPAWSLVEAPTPEPPSEPSVEEQLAQLRDLYIDTATERDMANSYICDLLAEIAAFQSRAAEPVGVATPQPSAALVSVLCEIEEYHRLECEDMHGSTPDRGPECCFHARAADAAGRAALVFGQQP